MLNKRRLTLPAIYTLSSFCLKSGFLSDFERFWVRRLLFRILVEGQGRNLYFERVQRRSDFSPKITSLPIQTLQQKGPKIHPSPRTFWSKIHPKGSELALEENNLTVFERSKCVARFIRASEKSSRWLPLFDWMSSTKWLNGNWFNADLLSDYILFLKKLYRTTWPETFRPRTIMRPRD